MMSSTHPRRPARTRAILIRLYPDEYEPLRRLAVARDRPVAYVARQFIVDGLASLKSVNTGRADGAHETSAEPSSASQGTGDSLSVKRRVSRETRRRSVQDAVNEWRRQRSEI